jgi:hypothetical protein
MCFPDASNMPEPEPDFFQPDLFQTEPPQSDLAEAEPAPAEPASAIPAEGEESIQADPVESESSPPGEPGLEPAQPESPPLNPVEQVLTRVASAAQNAGFHDFLLVGGNAIILLGIPRFTRDVDFLIPADDELRWREFLEQQGFAFGHGTPGFSQFFPEDPAVPRIDLMLVDQTTWEKLSAEAQMKELSPELTVRLPVTHHLIAMKLRAAKSSTRANPEQDWSDVAGLIRQHDYSLEDPSFRELVVKFGGEEAVATLAALLSRSTEP